jgi:thymidylate synthase (FAD)
VYANGELMKMNQGWVKLCDVMGSDHTIAESARICYGTDEGNEDADKRLIKHLIIKGHTSPFEQAEMKFKLCVPMDIWRQVVRHRTASIVERSTRYTVSDCEFWKAIRWRKVNGEFTDDEIDELNRTENEFHNLAENLYLRRIELGVVREQARKDLPLSTMTVAYWKIDLHNLLHFLELRLHPSAQHETRLYANLIANYVAEKFPITWAAFKEVKLNN